MLAALSVRCGGARGGFAGRPSDMLSSGILPVSFPYSAGVTPMMWFRKALVRQSVQRQTTFRPRLESLEDRVTPSIDVTSTLLSAVPDVPVATTSGQIHMETPPVAIPLVHSSNWITRYPGVTIKGQALDASHTRLIQVGYAHDPVSSDIDIFVSYTLLSDGSGSGTLFNLAGTNLKGAGVDVDSTGIIYVAGTQGSQGLVMRVE